MNSELCDCGAPAVSRCGTGGDYPTVVHCEKPVCKLNGQWCEVHRHKQGTMTYGFMNPEMRAEFEGFVSDGTVWDDIKTFFWQLMPLKWKLAKVLEQHKRSVPPPAPMPKLVLFVGGRRFAEKNGIMEEANE